MKKKAPQEVISCDGQRLKAMFAAATTWLERNSAAIDLLNVFPVPDGDTGTNMLLTMRATMEETYQTSDRSASGVLQAMARGALMGARGNSGVILSQIFRGLARGLEKKRTFGGSDLAYALGEASAAAYKAVSKPVEGTILTVIREASTAAQDRASTSDSDLVVIMEVVAAAAEAAVIRTPSLLPVLREAGVVDAGGQGLYVIFQGALRYLRGEVGEEKEYQRPQMMKSPPISSLRDKWPAMAQEQQYGYCTEFLIQGRGMDFPQIREKLEAMGESVLVVGNDATLRVHIHTFDPGPIVSYATSLGTLHQVKIQNIDEQHQDFLSARSTALQPVDIATVAVVSGDGLAQLFQSLGVTAIVPGGQTTNPSTQDLLQGVESAPSDKVILLPNNKNVVLAARQVQSLTPKRVVVVPTETVPQGVAALLAFNYEADLDTNRAAMEESLSGVRTGEITTSVRSTQVGGLKVKEGQAIGLLDGELVAVGDSIPQVLIHLLSEMEIERSELVTIYYGADIDRAEAERMVGSIQAKFPGKDVELVSGGQPHYHYIVSVE